MADATDDDDRAYFRMRAARHRELAERCGDADERHIHQCFADLYARRSEGIVVEDD